MRYFSEELRILDRNTVRFMVNDLLQQRDDMQQKVQKVLQLLQDPGVVNDPQMLQSIVQLLQEVKQTGNDTPQKDLVDQP